MHGELIQEGLIMNKDTKRRLKEEKRRLDESLVRRWQPVKKNRYTRWW